MESLPGTEPLAACWASAFFFGYILIHLPAGVLAQKIGPRWVHLVGMIVATAASLLCPVTARISEWALLANRIIMGLGCVSNMSISLWVHRILKVCAIGWAIKRLRNYCIEAVCLSVCMSVWLSNDMPLFCNFLDVMTYLYQRTKCSVILWS